MLEGSRFHDLGVVVKDPALNCSLVPKQRHPSHEVLVLTRVRPLMKQRTRSVLSDPWAFPLGNSCVLPREWRAVFLLIERLTRLHRR